MKKKCDVARLLKAVLKTGRAGALVLGAVAALAGCATTRGAVTTAPDGQEVAVLTGGILSGWTMNELSAAKIELVLYTLGEFFVECRERGVEQAHADRLADTVVFDDPTTTQFFRLAWDACADNGVDAAEIMWDEIAWQAMVQTGGMSTQTEVEIELLETIVPQIWRDDYKGFIALTMSWAQYSGGDILEMFQRSANWDGYDPFEGGTTFGGESIPGMIVVLDTEKYDEWGYHWGPVGATDGEWDYYYDPGAAVQYDNVFYVLAEFLAACRERGIDNTDADALFFGGIEGKYLTEYFKAGVGLIREGKDDLERALRKLWFQTAARADFFYRVIEFQEELNHVRYVLDMLTEDDALDDESLGAFLALAVERCSREGYAAVAALLPGVQPLVWRPLE